MLMTKLISKLESNQCFVRTQFQVNWGNKIISFKEVSPYENYTPFSRLPAQKKHRDFFLERNLGQLWFHPADFELAVSYSCGLVLSVGKPYLKVIETETGMQAVNLSDFLKADCLGWEAERLLASERKHCTAGGRLLIDEVVAAKENTSQMETAWVYCSSQDRSLQGQAWMVLAWVKENQVKVVGCKKITEESQRMELALALVDEFLIEGIEIKGVSADGFFFKKDWVKALKTRKIELISKPRRDSKWYVGHQPIQLKEYAQSLPIETFHYYSQEKVYAKALIVSNQKYGYCKVVIVRPKRSSGEKKWKYWICTNLKATVRDILRGKNQRWKIEVTFRDSSQNLGLKDNQCYSVGSSERHVSMVFMTYNYLSEMRSHKGQTIGHWKRKLRAVYNQERTSIASQCMNERVS